MVRICLFNLSVNNEMSIVLFILSIAYCYFIAKIEYYLFLSGKYNTSQMHTLLLLSRLPFYMVCLLPLIDKGVWSGLLCVMGLCLTFPFFHDGFYYHFNGLGFISDGDGQSKAKINITFFWRVIMLCFGLSIILWYNILTTR